MKKRNSSVSYPQDKGTDTKRYKNRLEKLYEDTGTCRCRIEVSMGLF